jgi:hypothetical protein
VKRGLKAIASRWLLWWQKRASRLAASFQSFLSILKKTPVPDRDLQKKPRHYQTHTFAESSAELLLTNAELLMAKQKVESANRAKSEFLAVGGYFKDPTGTSKMVGTNQSGSGENFTLKKQDMPKLKEQLESVIRQAPELESGSRDTTPLRPGFASPRICRPTAS